MTLSRTRIVAIGFLAIIGFLLVLEHRAHIPGDLWLLGGFLLACIVMHLFMHGALHNHGDGDGA